MKKEIIGNHTLYCGDCLEVMSMLTTKSIDLILTDPPYGMDFQCGTRNNKFEKIKNDNNLEWLPTLLNNFAKVVKEQYQIYCFCSWHNIEIFKMNFQNVFNLKNILVWEKDGFGLGDLFNDYAPLYELILYVNKNKPLNGKRHSNILNFKKIKKMEAHPTEKPLDLISFLIEKGSNQNEIVLDPFMGSGTTGVACEKNMRTFIGIELDQKYFDTACKRIESEYNQIKFDFGV